MTLIKLKPTSPGRRAQIKVLTSGLYKGEPYRPLLAKQKKNSGRNNDGRITVRHRGGGSKQRYRKVDFKRDKNDIIAKVEHIEYDPNRTAYIALLLYVDGERRYIIAPQGVKEGDEVMSGDSVPIQTGNCLPLTAMPLGTTVHCVEMRVGKGAQMVRSAGTSAQLVAREGNYATIRMRSGETRKIWSACRATIGAVSNGEHALISLGKAGVQRWRGIRPTVRGVVMNPVDHPHGGGEGRSSGGRHPVTPWGVPTKGYKTRKNKRSDHLITRKRRR